MSVTADEAREYAAAILSASDSAKVNAIIGAIEQAQRRVRAGGADVLAALASVAGQHLAGVEASGPHGSETAAGFAMMLGMNQDAAREAIRRGGGS